LARLYPKLAIVSTDVDAKTESEKLSALALAINPELSLTSTSKGVTHWLVVGKTPPSDVRRGAHTIYMGSSNWTVKLSMTKAVGSGATKNPFGAGTSACLGVANLFRIVFAAQLPGATLDESVIFSLLNLDRAASKKIGTYKAPDVGQFFLAGAGAIGNGALWALGRSGIRGELIVVDPQKLELSNLQRYVMTVIEDIDHVKTKLAKGWLTGSKGLAVTPITKTWYDFAHHSDWKFERVLVALDSAEDRIGVQASLPKWIANSYTVDSGIGVSRHYFTGKCACLACVYLPNIAVPSEDVLIASALGFQAIQQHPELMEIRRRLDRAEPCQREFLDIVAARKNIPIEKLLPFENLTLREFYQRGVCGGQVLGIEVDGRETRAEVPMAFQSAMAGVLLAAELVLEATGVRDPEFPTITRIDMHRKLPEVASAPRGKDPIGRCICQDQDYIAVYNDKYNIAR
jgi:hypothetical protein